MSVRIWNHLEENWSEAYRVYERNEFPKNSEVETEKPLAGQALKKPWASNLHRQERSYEMWLTFEESVHLPGRSSLQTRELSPENQ